MASQFHYVNYVASVYLNLKTCNYMLNMIAFSFKSILNLLLQGK